MPDIKLFWYKRKKNGVPIADKINLGDEIGPLIVAALSGRKVVRSSLRDCDLISVGSILAWPLKREILEGRKRPLHIWGSGLMVPQKVEITDNVHVASVRGHLTKCMIEPEVSVPLGDPGLLSADLWTPSPRREHYLGIIPHWTQLSDPLIESIHRSVPRSVIIDVTDPDIKRTMSVISSCDRIVASSLHGLVIADSYKIPNIWIKGRSVNPGGGWKFYDYFSSIGRDRFDPVDVMLNLDGIKEDSGDLFSQAHHKNIDALKMSIQQSFPAALI